MAYRFDPTLCQNLKTHFSVPGETAINLTLVVCQLDYWLRAKGGLDKDGRHWVWKTTKDFQKDFPHVGSRYAWNRILGEGERVGILLSERYPRGKLYSMDFNRVFGRMETWYGLDAYDHKMFPERGWYPSRTKD